MGKETIGLLAVPRSVLLGLFGSMLVAAAGLGWVYVTRGAALRLAAVLCVPGLVQSTRQAERTLVLAITTDVRVATVEWLADPSLELLQAPLVLDRGKYQLTQIEGLPKATTYQITAQWLTQAECNRIAKDLNDRPRERLGFRSPAEAFIGRLRGIALQS